MSEGAIVQSCVEDTLGEFPAGLHVHFIGGQFVVVVEVD